MKNLQAAFQAVPVIGIIRGIKKEDVLPVVNAAFDGGLTCVEITLNTAGALDLISLSAGQKRSAAFIGAGTVLDAESCENAIRAGAQFIVAPNTRADVMSVCKKHAIPVFPGALTPSEVHSAWEAGAYMVKVFPVSALGGPSYIRELRGPFGSIKLLACGGVTPDNIHEYFMAGASGIAIGGGIFKNEWITSKNYAMVQEKARELALAAVHACRGPM